MIILCYVRIFIAFIVAAVAYAVFAIFFLLRPFHKNNSYYCNNTVAKIIFWILRIKYTRRNYDRFKDYFDCSMGAKTPMKILIANHQHTLDLFAVGGTLPPGVVTIGKRIICLIPFLGWAFMLGGNILINRRDRKSAFATMKAVKEKMHAQQVSVCILPEGTRSWGRGLLKFKKGAFYLALDAKAPIVPMIVSSIHKTVDLRRWNSGEIIVDVLPELDMEVDGEGVTIENLNEFIESVRNMYLKHIEELDKEILERLNWKK
ncbi:MAG: 1-acyl-sn-glycerol-3-phosphate acyltransferase [Oligoflexia bacterium]|nr:1-acyl-sn-glycerol-3-phosphate acyltransferase [Oligoflexia bacterium]